MRDSFKNFKDLGNQIEVFQNRKRYGGMRDFVYISNAFSLQMFQNRKRYGGMRDDNQRGIKAALKRVSKPQAVWRHARPYRKRDFRRQ